jgi:small-conductance mechanosensitive channel
VRFVRVTPTGLDFELFVFVARLEDRLVVGNDLNKAILARLIELKIVDPKPVPEYKVHHVSDPPVATAVHEPSDARPAA